MRSCTGVLLLCLLGLASADAAERRALVIGVSDYDALPPRGAGGPGPFDLEGPKHDVPLVVRMARDLGVPEANLAVLASGADPARAPTRAAILGGLRQLAGHSAPGDQVLVYFSGHGSQMPDLEGEEADGLDEILLPADIGTWNDDLQVIDNAITDDEFGLAIEAIRSRGASVWVVVDSCHSGTALRGGPVLLPDAVEKKGVQAAALGIPQARLGAAHSRAAAGTGRFEPGALDAAGTAGAGLVAFYAATAEEAAIAAPQRMPDGSTTPTVSLLTFALAEAVAGGQVESYRDLAMVVRGFYDAAGTIAPQPAFEGDFDRALFGHASVPPRQWQVRRSGEDYVAAGGNLDGLHAGAILALRDPRLPASPVLAYLRVQESGANSAKLVPVAHGGLGTDAARSLGATAFAATQVVAGVPMAIRIALPPEGGPAVAGIVREALARLVPEQGREGIEFVAPGAPADVYLRVGEDRLWLADSASGFATTGRQQPPFLPLARDATADDFAPRLAERIGRFARSSRLLAVMRALESALSGQLAVSVLVDSSARRTETEACPAPPRIAPASARTLQAIAEEEGGVPMLRHCDVVYMTLENRGARTVDVTPLYFDRDSGISYLGSGELEDFRVEPGASRTWLAPITTYDVGAGHAFPLGLEQLVLVAVPRETGQERPATYAYLAQGGATAPARAAGEATDLDRLVDAAGFGGGASRAASAAHGTAGTFRASWIVAVP